MKLKKYIFMAVVAVVLSTAMGSCKMYSNYTLPTEGLVGEYAQVKNEPVDSTALGNLDWRQIFTDPTLQGYIQRALDNNIDLENAKLNVDIAQAQLQGAKLSYLPSVALSPNGAGSKYFIDGSKFSWTYQLPLAASWEVDIFGRTLNANRKAKQALLQSQDYRQAVRSQIIGAVANTYYALVTLRKQHTILTQTAKNWKESVEIMKQMKEAGRYNEVAVVQSQANYCSVMASIPSVEMSINEANNTMSLLLNEKMTVWQVNEDAAPLVLTAAAVEGGIPVKYVASRPDVSAAEHSFAAAYYQTNMARSAFYPSLNISAQGGFTNIVGSAIMNPGKWFLNLAASLTAPLFARGQNIMNLKVSKAAQEQALNKFEYTVLNACAEVSNAYVTMTKTSEQQQYYQEQVDNLAKAVEYNRDLQQLATATYLEVITAQTQLLAAQRQMLSNELAISRASIALYQSLGGGR